MTKEEILEKNGFDFEAFKLDNEYSAKSILTSMDEYANQKAIEFAEWLNKEGYQEYDYYGHWIAPQNNNNVYNTQQVYEMFITQ